MSLGDVTKCDLSAGVAEIDREILIEMLKHYYWSIEQKLHNMTANVSTQGGTVFNVVCTEGKKIHLLTMDLRQTAELLYTLQESITREKIIWAD